MATSLYDKDFAQWAADTADALRERRFDEVDVEHLVEEVEGLASKDFRELRSRLIILLMHLLKWQFQADGRSASWKATINIQRIDIEGILEASPSLRARIPLGTAFEKARKSAEMETMLASGTFPNHCPYTLDQILDESFWPEA